MPLPKDVLSQYAFDGMRDALEPQTGSARKAKLLLNVYPQDERFGGGLTGRPGFQVMGVQIGSGGTVQRVYQYTKLAGTETTVGFAGGLMYTFNWSTRAWTGVTLVGVSLHASARIFCTTYTDKLIVNPNDGTNKPWMWDGTTFTSLTNCPTLYGRLVVHYGKLFGIKWAARGTIVWSEENDPTLGYDTAPYTNSWQLSQTSPEPLRVLHATNAGLYYWRPRSAGIITGAVTPDFSSTGTHDALSESTGAADPNALIPYDTEVFFLDADGRPNVLTVGGGIRPIWDDLRNTLINVPRSTLNVSVGAAWPQIPLVLLGLAEINQTVPNVAVAIQPGDPESPIAGLWRGFPMASLDTVKDGNSVPVIVHGSSDGYVYDHGQADGTLWNDALQAGTVAISHQVQGSYLGVETRRNRRYDLIEISLKAFSSMTGVTFSYETPTQQETSAAFSVSGGTGIWDQGVWDTATWSVPGAEARGQIGIEAVGPWLLPQLLHSGTSEQFGFNGWAVDSYLEPAREASAP